MVPLVILFGHAHMVIESALHAIPYLMTPQQPARISSGL